MRQVTEERYLEFALAVLQQVEGAGEGGDLHLEVDIRQLRVEGADQVRQRPAAIGFGQARHLGHRHSPLFGGREGVGPGQEQAEAEQRQSAHGSPGGERYA
ncbi:hypothetical protein D3C78_1713370 [compost metagenome]